MIERLTKCPLCKSGLFLNSKEVIDHAVSKESFIICKCTSCDILFTNPRPTQEEISKYYDFPEYYSHNDSPKGITQYIYNKIRSIAIKGKISLLTELKPKKGSLLDFGCGTAEFIYQAEQKGWKVTGIEPNTKAKEQALTKLENQIHSNLDGLNKNDRFDLITMFHVLEHVHELRKTVKKIIKHLKSNGYIIIAVPNPASFDAEVYREKWAGWDVPRHLYHFTPKSIESFQEIFDLELIDQKKMPFDSYYVSLLSEGYKAPQTSMLSKYWKAIKTGYKSNSLAKTQGSNYSSNLYIFKKK
ncbi:class I SAM-dependent methyltransferase [Algoriphagus marinus]|uniref:class I SAM-dependent methyltransferase n=1 Tax=Algoriphagus marinus TaxID=1925762 RepID=UPI00094B85B3|nr:class I SAM-dependent methyltransferase [Algoriphagus marinus]